MTPPNETAIRCAIAQLKETYPWTTGRSQTYYEALCDLWPEDVEAGVTATLRAWRTTGCPPPGFVRERALAARAGRDRPARAPSVGPVAWHKARLPLRDNGKGYLQDADGRYVMLPPRPWPKLERDDVPNHVPKEWG